MLKRFLVLLACISLLFVSPIFADELEVKQNLPVMDEESINSSLQKAGLKSVNINPSYNDVPNSILRWNVSPDGFISSSSLNNGQTAYGYTVYFEVDSSEMPKHNKITFNFNPSYFNGISSYVIIEGSCDDIVLESNKIIIYNPHNSDDDSIVYDFKLKLIGNNPFTNNTGSSMPLEIHGNKVVYSSGTELLDVLMQYFTVNQVVVIISAAVGSCISLVFMWWGVRKMAGAIMSAFRRGKLRI